MTRRRLHTLVLGILVMMLCASGVAGAEPVEPCLNYVHREEAGRVEIDLRPDPVLGTFSTLTMFWFIDEPQARKGIYIWNHIINGRTTPRSTSTIKDDGLHTSLRMYDRSRPIECGDWGDVYTFQATHFSPETKTSYVAAVNRCRITPRT